MVSKLMAGIFPERNEGRKQAGWGESLIAVFLMAAMATERHSDPRSRFDPIVASQHGVISRAQLREIGMSEGAIRHAIDKGLLHPVFRGVYAFGRVQIGQHGRRFAAVLACGKQAVISHRSAAAMLGLLDRAPAVVDITSPTQRGRRIDGVRCHQALLRIGETGTVDGIPCTSPARTLVDCAGEVGVRTLRSMFERAAAKKMLDLDAIETSMRPGRRGMPALRALIEEWRLAAPIAQTARLKSPLEAKVLPLVVRRGMPAPLCNAPVRLAGGQRIEVDLLWPEQRFVLEADSRGFHATDYASERDRWRDRELLRAGYSWLRVTRLQAESEPDEVADAVFQRLSTS